MFIQTEATSDPATTRFAPGRDVTGGRSVRFAGADEAAASPLAQRLFAIDGVAAVALGPQDIGVTKSAEADWADLRPAVLRAVMEHFMGDEPVLTDAASDGGADDEVVAQIKELIETRIYPAVAQGGGDITFHGFEAGVVLLDLQGSALGMKQGIENMLRHYVPEVNRVESYEEYTRLQKPELNTPTALTIRELLDQQVNPAVAAHGGHIALIDVQDDTVYIRLEGGCQGCGMADVTLKQGVETAIRRAVPRIAAVLDVTDHAGGSNPYYSPGKGGMSPF